MVCLVWLWVWVVVWVCCMLAAAASMRAATVSLFVVMRGRGAVALAPSWLGGSSCCGRFGDIGVSIRTSSNAAGEGGWRALHDPIVLTIVGSWSEGK